MRPILAPAALRSAARVTAILVVTGVWFGCAQIGGRNLWPWSAAMASGSDVTREDLREEVITYLGSFSAIVVGAADLIADLDPDPTVRRRTLFWKLHMIPTAQDAALLDDPLEGFAGLAGVAVAQRQYLTEGDGRAIFGAHQAIAVRAAERAESEVYEIGAQFLTESELARLRADTEAFMQRRPISGHDFAVSSIATTRNAAQSDGGLDWLTTIPLSPFRALEGVGEGASAVRDFNDTAIRFAAIVEGLPAQMRWQSELLLFDVESRDAMQRALGSSEALAASAERLTLAFEALPQETQRLLDQSQGAVAQANATLRTAREMLEPLQALAGEISAAGSAWEQVVRGDGQAGAEGRPFDVREWESALKETTTAAAELRALAVELRALSESETLSATTGLVGDSVSLAQSGARDVVDHAAWRAAQLIVGFFVLLALYRLGLWMTTRRAGSN